MMVKVLLPWDEGSGRASVRGSVKLSSEKKDSAKQLLGRCVQKRESGQPSWEEATSSSCTTPKLSVFKEQKWLRCSGLGEETKRGSEKHVQIDLPLMVEEANCTLPDGSKAKRHAS